MDNPVSTTIILWGATTGRAMRAHWMLHEFGLPYESRPVRPRTGETQTSEYLAINPKGKIPTLQHGSLTLSESVAIIRYISNNFEPTQEFFVPANSQEEARLDEWCSFISMELDAHPLYTIRRHGDLHKIYGRAPEAVESARRYFLKQFNTVVPPALSAAPFLMGGFLSIADILLLTCIDWARDYDIELADVVIGYQKRLHSRTQYQSARKICFPSNESLRKS